MDVLIRAGGLLKAEISDIKGDWSERMRLEKLVRNLGLNGDVEFKEFLKKHSDIIASMQSSKVFEGFDVF